MLFVGDDWLRIIMTCVQDAAGKVRAARRLPEGVAGITRLHELIVCHLDGDDAGQVALATGTDRGPWVRALVAAGYRVYAVSPKQAARHREVVAVSGKKEDTFDAGALADMARTRGHQLRLVAADSDEAEAVKVAARAHQRLVGERTRHVLRMRSALREYFPAALEAYPPLTLTGSGTLELLAKAPGPAAAARLTITQITAALKRARRHGAAARAEQIQAALRGPQLGRSEIVTEAYAAGVTAAAAVMAVLNEQVKKLEAVVESLFRRRPDAGLYLSQPGIGVITGARMPGEFGDEPGRYADAKARRNYAATSPLTIASGTRKIVHARFVHNHHLVSAMHDQAFSAISTSPGARACCDEVRSRQIDHTDALRRVAHRMAGILHGCLKTGAAYHENTARGHRRQPAAA